MRETEAALKVAAAVVAFFEALGLEDLPPAERARLLANDHLALRAYLAGLTGEVAPPAPAERLLAMMTLPCLLFAGEADFNFEGAKRAAAALPNATFIALPGLDHLQTFSRLDLVAPLVKGFLATVS